MKTEHGLALIIAAAIAAAALIAAPAVALAETTPAPTCSTAMDKALPAAWQTWTTPEALAVAETAATQPEMTVGHAYKVTLSPIAKVEYTVAPSKIKDGTFGGMVMLTIDKAGIYTVGVDQAAWVDMIRDGQALKTASFGHGPDCSTIHKMVNFDLTPGHYTLQISNAAKQASVIAVIAK